MLAVPMVAGDTLVGVIVLSSLGYGMFDEEDQRMVEVLAPHAAAAFQNASLLEAERDAARAAGALLQLSQSLTGRRNVGEIFRDAIESMETIIRCAATAAYVRDETGAFRVIQLHACGGRTVRPRAEIADVPPTVAETLLSSTASPFVIPQAVAAQVPDDVKIMDGFGDILVCPLQWEPGEVGALIAVGDMDGDPFDESAVRLARGIGDLTALALGNARRISELERFHRLVESLDAVFWEAEADGLRVTFLGGRVEELFGTDANAWLDRPWGEHITDADRSLAVAEVRRAIAEGADASVEYRVGAPGGDGRWLRDLVTVVRGSQGPRQVRGLTIDVTERRHAEQTLRESERKYSEAFLREREAAEQLRALDAMKNTFLEAVSHDLRTPLTSILGSALTLEQSRLEMPASDALDLVHRVAANARKLERLLGDLLDLDRLQRGIVSPQRRSTDIGALIARVLAEVENPDGRTIDVEVGLLTAAVDGPKVERIVENLVANALRHTTPEAHVLVWARAVDGGIEVGVDDAGPGVPDDARESIFEPFEQRPGPTSGHSPGVGIGLSLVRRFAELHDGRAWVEATRRWRFVVPGVPPQRLAASRDTVLRRGPPRLERHRCRRERHARCRRLGCRRRRSHRGGRSHRRGNRRDPRARSMAVAWSSRPASSTSTTTPTSRRSSCPRCPARFGRASRPSSSATAARRPSRCRRGRKDSRSRTSGPARIIRRRPGPGGPSTWTRSTPRGRRSTSRHWSGTDPSVARCSAMTGGRPPVKSSHGCGRSCARPSRKARWGCRPA